MTIWMSMSKSVLIANTRLSVSVKSVLLTSKITCGGNSHVKAELTVLCS